MKLKTRLYRLYRLEATSNDWAMGFNRLLVIIKLMTISLRQNWVGYLIVACSVAFATILYRGVLLGINATTVALSFLLVVLAAVSSYGLSPAIKVLNSGAC